MQGFPEGWVDGLTRTAALRVLGNAVVPQVAELFGRSLLGHGGGCVQPDRTLLPTPTATYPGGEVDAYRARLDEARGGTAGAAPLNMLIEQVLAS